MDVADVAGLVSHTCGVEEGDKFVLVIRKDVVVDPRQITALKLGFEWDPEAAHRVRQPIYYSSKMSDDA